MNDRLTKACRGEKTDRPPVWMMRQAGRYLGEYREIRRNVPFLDLCKTPELACEVSLQPYRILGVDGVILFSDILIPVAAMGLTVEMTDRGPRIPDPVRTEGDIERVRLPDVEAEMPFTFETIRLLCRELDGKVPVLGFAGAPWTLAAYMIEGKTSRNFERIKRFGYQEPEAFDRLLDRIATVITRYLVAQVEAGASVVQLFDTWAGMLSPADYRRYALPYEKAVIEGVQRAVDAPVVLYINGCATILEAMAETGADVLSIDWRIDLSEAVARLDRIGGPPPAIQGNLDPCLLLGPRSLVVERTEEILKKGRSAKAHILNLGHGILPETPVENAKAFVETAQRYPLESFDRGETR